MTRRAYVTGGVRSSGESRPPRSGDYRTIRR